MMFSSIIMVQILAHLPLADIVFPANALETFEIMIGIVSLDYFSPGEYVDMGLSDTPAWSGYFEFVGYDSVNFLDGMGSIYIFAIIQIVYIILAIILGCIKVACIQWFYKKLDLGQIHVSSLGFIHGCFFEVLICVSISMYMLDFYDYLNPHDQYCVFLQFLFSAILIAYLSYVLYFTIFKAGALAKKTELQKLQEDKL